jgi:uncharacterized protein
MVGCKPPKIQEETSMKREVVFIQGGGEGAYALDHKLVESLQQALGTDYHVQYPRMPHEDDPDYSPWKARIHQTIAALPADSFLVGHSVGAYILVKYLSQESLPATSIRGIGLIAAPYPGGDEQWQFEGFSLPDGFGRRLPANARIFLYHSPDDQTVPFAHMRLYAQQIPGAVTREPSGGHQLNDDLAMVAHDIQATFASLSS